MNQSDVEIIVQISGRMVHIVRHGIGGPCIYWGMQQRREDEVTITEEYLKEYVRDQPYLLVAFQVKDWNREFSPWKAPAVYGTEGFLGGGEETLDWLLTSCIPYIEAEYPKTAGAGRLLAGYSLAGLFSLWAFFKSGTFAGAASCSGSLWFPGWEKFSETAIAPRNGIVYLSLGTKEEKTRNTVMARIGDATRKLERDLKKNPSIQAVKLEWNLGGHFTNPQQRMAKGMAWLVCQIDRIMYDNTSVKDEEE